MPKVLWCLVLILMLPLPASGDVDCGGDLKAKDVLIELDTTGISNWRFLNPRNPFPVVAPKTPDEGMGAAWEDCARRARITFSNATSGQALVVTIPYTHRRISLGSLVDPLREQTDHLDSARTEVANSGNTSLEQAVGADTDALIRDVRRLLRQLEQWAQRLAQTPSDLESQAAMLQEIDRTLQQEARERGEATAGSATMEAMLNSPVALSERLRADISEWKKKNPDADSRAVAAADRLADELQRLEAWLQETLRALDASAERPPLSECGDVTAAVQNCSFQFTLFDNGSFTIPPAVWARLVRFSDGTVRFNVRFFDEQVPPTNTEGYLRVRTKIRERDSATSWQLAGAVGYSVAPESKRTVRTTDASGNPKDEPRPFTLLDPFTGRKLDTFNGQARFEMSQTLRDRARGRVTAQFKSGVLGEKSSGTVNVTQYSVDVYGINFLSLRFGKYRMLQPARAAAISETGEGFQLSFPYVRVGHLVRRESLDFVANDANEDASVSFAQASFPGNFLIFRNLDLFLLYGEEKKPTRYEYSTIGGQFYFADSTNHDAGVAIGKVFRSVSGSASYFYSDRNAETPAAGTMATVVDGTGRVWLLDAGFTWLRNTGATSKPLRTVGLLVGAGTGDDASTPASDESYLGETAAFTGYDSLLLGSFAEQLRVLGTDGTPSPVSAIGKGLANKFYAGASYVERAKTGLNLLWWAARGLGVLDDLKSSATTLRVHWFHLDEPFAGSRDAGWETSLQWQVEVPEGVTTTLGCSRYFAGNATKGLFASKPMSCSALVSLTLR